MQPVSVIAAVEPRIYGEALAFSLKERRPGAEALLAPTDDLVGEVGRVGAHLMLASRVQPVAKEAAFWTEVGVGRRLDEKISANEYSRSVRDLRVEHRLAVVDGAEERFVSGGFARAT